MNNKVCDPLDSFDYFDMTPDLVCIAGKDGYFRRINQSVINKLGFSREELFAAPINSFIYEGDRERTSNNRNKLLGGEILQNFQNRYVTKAGHILWLEWTAIYFTEKDLILAIAKDITARKQLELAIENQYKRFKDLTAYFKGSIEKERRHIAYELHEDVAQLAAVVRLNLDLAIAGAAALPEDTITHLTNAISTTTLLIQTIQKIALTVSPFMLEEFGLHVTIKWLCDEFAAINQISCKFSGGVDERSLTKELQTDFFRICQEALNNVALHAAATAVSIKLEETDGRIKLCIKDNGKGFNVNNKAESHGLVAIQERAASVHGTFSIKSSPGKGTAVCVTVPKPVS